MPPGDNLLHIRRQLNLIKWMLALNIVLILVIVAVVFVK
jgi:hypothetical protein